MTSDLGESDKKHFLAPLSPTHQNTVRNSSVSVSIGTEHLSLRLGMLMDKTHQFFSVIAGGLLEVSSWPLLNSVCGMTL